MFATKGRADLTGLAPTECAKACNVERCVISGRGFCLHPKKASFPPAFESNPDVQSAWAEACQLLDVKNKRLAAS